MAILLGFLGVGLIACWAWENRRRETHPVSAGHQPQISLPHDQEFELYHNAFSLCSMKVRVCLAELGIAYESHPIDLIETGAYENIGRAFLSINPAGSVPVLVHEGHPVYESHEQIRYAAAHAPAGAPRLVPQDPGLRDEMERWIDRSSITRDPLAEGERSAGNTIPGLTFPIFATMIEDIPQHRIFEGVLFHFDKIRPFLFLTLKAVGVRRIPVLKPLMRILSRSRRQLGVHLDALEKQLAQSGGPWILGADFSLADVSWLVIFERLAQVDALDLFIKPRAGCAAYWTRLRERPAYQKAIMDHAHPLVALGTERIRRAKASDARLRAALEGSDGQADVTRSSPPGRRSRP